MKFQSPPSEARFPDLENEVLERWTARGPMTGQYGDRGRRRRYDVEKLLAA